MSKKQEKERQSLILVSVSFLLVVITSWPAEITTEAPISIIAVICYAATAVVLIVEWIKHFLKFRNSED
ncbi:MAG: hypothetical protein IJF02_02910 [Oscillospiraceae bacterium]|nr:hypothetical protein [Oscillospiraceae bacterium]